MKTHFISSKLLDFEIIERILKDDAQLALSEESKAKIKKCRSYLDGKLKGNSEPIYGINTGFGALYNKSIPAKDMEKLQRNLVMSHACGTGEEVPLEIVKLMLLLQVQGVSYGNSGIQMQTV